MKILLTGSSGFFANEFIKYISSKSKIKLFCISRKKKNINNIVFWNLDLSKKKIKNIPKNFFFDLIIHSAFVRMGKNKNSEILKKNINITNNLILILKKNSFKKIINFSSSSVYPNIDGKFSEKNEINFFQNTDSIYGLSKYLAENIFNCCLKKSKLIHLRIANIIGNDHDKSIISEMKNSLKNKNLIDIYGNGNRVINLIHVKSLIRYIFLIKNINANGILNVSDYSFNLRQIAILIKKKYGNKYSKILFKKINIPNPKFYMNTNKFFNLLNIKKLKKKDLFNEI
jgi:nucleoside-diphosphate-sugar epimerase